MANYEETSGMPLKELALGMGPFFAAQYFHKTEGKMAAQVAAQNAMKSSLSQSYLPDLAKNKLRSMGSLGEKALKMKISSQQTRVALKIASKHGVLKTSAWSAAKSANLMGPMSKILASRAAGVFMNVYNTTWFAPLMFSGVKGAINGLREIGINTRRLEFGGNYIDTRGSYTERQRSLRAITSSRMSTRAAIGNEALLLHR